MNANPTESVQVAHEGFMSLDSSLRHEDTSRRLFHEVDDDDDRIAQRVDEARAFLVLIIAVSTGAACWAGPWFILYSSGVALLCYLSSIPLKNKSDRSPEIVGTWRQFFLSRKAVLLVTYVVFWTCLFRAVHFLCFPSDGDGDVERMAQVKLSNHRIESRSSSKVTVDMILETDAIATATAMDSVSLKTRDAMKEAEEKAKTALAAAEAEKKRKAEELAKKEAAEKAKREAKEAVDKARREVEKAKKARKEVEEKARKEAEKAARAAREAEEKAKREAEKAERAKREAEERAKKKAEAEAEKAKREAEEKAKREVQERAKREAEEAEIARKRAEEKAKKEAEAEAEKAKRKAEERAKRETEEAERAKRDAEEYERLKMKVASRSANEHGLVPGKEPTVHRRRHRRGLAKMWKSVRRAMLRKNGSGSLSLEEESCWTGDGGGCSVQLSRRRVWDPWMMDALLKAWNAHGVS
uniref:Uncharacterized protein n=2 Tax=Pseudictyota dubia TaxID=2749911 RepID=A0A7R9WEX1_9STRA|mmetsp:Transcript_46322/g.86113  ORF Transcript_46322/g.86113 Transcript_46322/m.86113 type:complete len:470 (+) Transcript_46322:142-1551(+)